MLVPTRAAAERRAWLRLDAESEWTSGAGQLTRQFYQSSRQRGQQLGNLTERQEFSHAETSLDLNLWESRVTTGSGLRLLRSTTTEYIPNYELAADVGSLIAPGMAGGGTAVRYADDAHAAKTLVQPTETPV